MKEKDYIRWRKFRKIGKLKYILLVSVFFIIVTNIFAYTLSHNFTFSIMYILGSVILSGSIGVVFGKITWSRSEIMYQLYINNKKI
jgi:hypothetical protein